MPKVYNGDLTKMFDISGKKAVIFGGAGGFGKESQFVEIFLRLALVLRLGDEGYEHGGFCLGFSGYKFFHRVLSSRRVNRNSFFHEIFFCQEIFFAHESHEFTRIFFNELNGDLFGRTNFH